MFDLFKNINVFSGRKSEIDVRARTEVLEDILHSDWRNMNNESKLKLFTELEHSIALEEGREPCTIKAIESDMNLGGYYNSEIEINFGTNNRFEDLDSYFHESKHYKQECAIKSERDDLITKIYEREFCEDLGNHVLYNSSFIEQECNHDAFIKVYGLMAGKINNPEFNEYISKRGIHFNNIQENINAKNYSTKNQKFISEPIELINTYQQEKILQSELTSGNKPNYKGNIVVSRRCESKYENEINLRGY